MAKFLLNYAENVALANNLKRCSLIAKDRYTSKFYEKLNYIILKDYEIFGHEIIKMAKNI